MAQHKRNDNVLGPPPWRGRSVAGTLVPNWLVATRRVSDDAFLFLLVLLGWCGARCHVASSVADVCRFLGKKRNTGFRLAREAEELGLFRRVSLGNQTVWVLDVGMYEFGKATRGFAPEVLLPKILAYEHRVDEYATLRIEAEEAYIQAREAASAQSGSGKAFQEACYREAREAQNTAFHRKQEVASEEFRYSFLDLPDELRRPRLRPGTYCTVPKGLVTRGLATKMGRRAVAGPVRLAMLLRLMARGQRELYATHKEILSGQPWSEDSLTRWLQALSRIKDIKVGYVTGRRRQSEVLAERKGGKLVPKVVDSVAEERHLQGLLITIPENKKTGKAQSRLNSLFVGWDVFDSPRRRP